MPDQAKSLSKDAISENRIDSKTIQTFELQNYSFII